MRPTKSIATKNTALALGALALALGVAATAVAPMARTAHIVHPKTGKPLTVPGQDGDATLLFNGWRIHPTGRSLATGDMLLGGAISPDGKSFAIANAGFADHAVHIVDIATEKEAAKIPVAHALNGIAWSPDGKTLYVGGGISPAGLDIYILENRDDKWAQTRTYKLTGNDRKKTCVAGLALSRDGKTLYALNNSDNRLYILDTQTGATLSHLDVGDHPVACVLNPAGNLLGVADWGGQQITVVSIADPSAPKVVSSLPAGEHPNAMTISGDNRLFVSCGNSDDVYVYDAGDGHKIETIKTTLQRSTPAGPVGESYYGSTPNAVAVSPDNATLYVANADNNDVAVIDVSRSGAGHVRGFIPTGWYPTTVAVSPDGKKVLIGSGKGIGAHPNPGTVKPDNPVAPADYRFEYIGNQLNGLLSFVDAPSDAQLKQYTQQVFADIPGSGGLQSGYPIGYFLQAAARKTMPVRKDGTWPIKHILYIIKENRTYDQVFGDIPTGNGDPSLTLFGREVTPNHHALAEQFVLLDNIYCNGEVSQDGHPWCTSAIATDWVQRSWVLGYSGKGETVTTDSVEVPHSGYLWDACNRKGLTYRSYGEYVYASGQTNAPEQKLEGAAGLIGHGSPSYIGVGRKGGQMRDTDKADAFIAELKDFDRTNTVPNFMVMSLGEDHTRGTSPGSNTPKACVASNDVALGKIVEAVSHSNAWKEFAIFVIEDDAQNGPDHVDSHRTAALVISPYTKRNYVDSTMYSTTSMVRTMELMLGLSPLTQYDAAAKPMIASFTVHPDLRPYTALPARIDLTAVNPKRAFGAAASAKMDFRGYDRADPDELNRILWHSIKGKDTPYPATVHTVIASNRAGARRDDD